MTELSSVDAFDTCREVYEAVVLKGYHVNKGFVPQVMLTEDGKYSFVAIAVLGDKIMPCREEQRNLLNEMGLQEDIPFYRPLENTGRVPPLNSPAFKALNPS